MSKFLKDRGTFKEAKKVKVVEQYSPIVNYENFELKEDDLKKMINCEKNILFHQQKSIEHLLSLSETLYEAQQILANYKNGGFRNWFEEMGLKKDFVYMCLKRYSLYLNYENKKVMAIPEKMVKELSTPKIILPKEQILEILESEKPVKKYEEIKNILSGDPTIYQNEISEAEIIIEGEDEVRELEKELAKKYSQVKELQKEIKDIEYRLSIMKNKIKTF
ncbi:MULTISPECIES: hypothetical protein [Cetobacterium]|uniref:DUF3102 domain-containing protein n=1 Tax=Candidatus Cetobacterium colombiensis TaxID=3073100 RepID=A0ABU4WDA5_9FUSO|nr:hypothetical protein [Candidatus Cetobacterium colombiensis]MDX8337515.1 hypothetical protein [Candidatus Cetobacterium colombiensis]